MSKKQIVWLLYPPTPSPEVSPIEHHQKVWAARHLTKMSWWQKVWIQFWVWWRRKELPQLTTTCPSLEQSQLQYRELNRILGPDFDCRAVHYLHQDFQMELQNLPSKSHLILVPMMILWGTQAISMIEDVQQRLQGLGHSIQRMEAMSQHEDFIAAYAQLIRQAVIESQFPQKYSVALFLQRDVQYWNSIDPKLEKAVHLFQHQLKQQLSMDIVILSNSHHANIPNYPEQHTIFYGFLNGMCSSYERLHPSLEFRPLQWRPLNNFNTQPAFMSILARSIEEQTGSK